MRFLPTGILSGWIMVRNCVIFIQMTMKPGVEDLQIFPHTKFYIF